MHMHWNVCPLCAHMYMRIYMHTCIVHKHVHVHVYARSHADRSATCLQSVLSAHSESQTVSRILPLRCSRFATPDLSSSRWLLILCFVMLALFGPTASGLTVNNAPVSRRAAVRSALSALVLAPAASAFAADNFGNYGDTTGYAAPPSIPGFQAGPTFGPGFSADGTRSTKAVGAAAPTGGEFAALVASSKASFEANTGLKMTADEEKKLEEKVRKKFPGMVRPAC